MSRCSLRRWVLVTAIVALGLGCGQGRDGDSAAPASPPAPAAAPDAAQPADESGAAPSAAAREEADQIFASRCTTCHGPQGEGDGPASAGLTPPPRNFHDPAFQDRVTDEHIEQIIQYGGAAVGLSPAMPPNPDLTSKPEVVAALREKIRSFGH
jgi:mono/diheme cytochrome c family protein